MDLELSLLERLPFEEIVKCSVCNQDEAYLIPGEAVPCPTCGSWIRYGT